MRNHWLKVHANKKIRYWSISFDDRYGQVLSSRKIALEKVDVDYITTSGTIAVMFSGVKLGSQDHQLIDFFARVKADIGRWSCKLSHGSDIEKDIEYYKGDRLTFVSVKPGDKMGDVILEFKCGKLIHYNYEY